jgi:phage terminase large subunit-like protein
MNNPHIQDIEQYINDVLSGRVLSCEHIKNAVRRHLADLESSKDSKYPYEFRPELAVKFISFCELHYHVKGKWRGQRIKLEPWQKFSFGIPFGWVRKQDGLRRYREIFALIARKNAKSTIAALIGLYMGAEDSSGAPEVYAGATSEKQAREVFDPAWKMAGTNSAFKVHYQLNLTGTESNPTGIFFMKNGGKFVPVIGNPGDGSSPSCSITDEYHEHPTSSQYDTMVTGMGAREQPLRLVISTAGTNISYPCFEKQQDCIKILQGVMKNDEIWAVIYTIDPEDDWRDFSCWAKANPNLGVSVFEDFLYARYEEAMTKAERQNIIRCKHLNEWQNSGQAFINIVEWSKGADPKLRLEDFEGEECALGLDLASKIDIAAYAKLFKREKVIYAFLRYYLPEMTVQKAENMHYQQWEKEGRLVVTPGARTDFEYIEEDIKADAKRFGIKGLGYDPYESGYLIGNLAKWEGSRIECIEVPQTATHISEPMKEFEGLVYDGKFKFDGDPILTWMVSNVIQKQARNKKYYPSRENVKNKIDGFMAVLMALLVWGAEIDQGPSIYETRGIMLL